MRHPVLPHRLLAATLAGALVVCATRTVRAAEEVKIETADQKTIHGLKSGGGETALLLCHGSGSKDGAASFKPQCEFFGNQGLPCLAISFRGYPSAKPPELPGKVYDIVAGFDFLVSKGATRVFVLGTSMGGFVAFDALDALQSRKEFAGLIIISAHHATACEKSTVPKLFIAAQDDQPTFAKVEQMFQSAALPKQFVSYSTGGHGRRLFHTQHNDLHDKILTFITTHSRPPTDKPPDE